MKAFCFSLTVLCVVQSILAIPRPDFGINGAVTNSDKTVTAALALGAEFAKTGAKSITPESGYGLLSTLQAALESIGDAFANIGGDLAAQLKLLAEDDNNMIDAAFDLVATKITALETLMDTGIDGQLATITTNTDTDDIVDQFEDAFAAMLVTIGNLKTAMGVLKTDIKKARTAAGSTNPVSATVIRKNVPSKSVTDVTLQIRKLLANIPVITYVINSSLENILLADMFIVEMEAEAQIVALDYATAVSAYRALLVDEAETLSSIIFETKGEDLDTILSDISNDLDDHIPYLQHLRPQISNINNQLLHNTASTSGRITGYFYSYGNAVSTMIANLNTELGNNLCETIKEVSGALVTNAPYSDFCFSKYSSRVYALLALTINSFDMCFERELSRLFSLHTIVERIVVQIVYNVEDIHENLSICLSAAELDEGECFATITPYYAVLATKAENLLATIGNLVDYETDASYYRLAACFAVSLYTTIDDGLEIIEAVDSCLVNGPTI